MSKLNDGFYFASKIQVFYPKGDLPVPYEVCDGDYQPKEIIVNLNKCTVQIEFNNGDMVCMSNMPFDCFLIKDV